MPPPDPDLEREMPKRPYIDPPTRDRCRATVTLTDGSTAQCGRRAGESGYCWQHAAQTTNRNMTPSKDK